MSVLRGFPQGYAVQIVPGAAAGTPLPNVSGIKPGDTLVNVRHITPDLVTNADVTANATITAPNEITVAVTNTAGAFVLAVWLREPA